MTATQPLDVRLEVLGRLEAVGRPGGQGRVVRPEYVPRWLGAPAVVKLYRHPLDEDAVSALAEMIAWERALATPARDWLSWVSAWPLGIATSAGRPVGIAMRDLTSRFAVPFTMPSGRRERVLLALEHLLGADSYLERRGLAITLDTVLRARVAEGICHALGVLHAHGIVVGDLAPRNLLISISPSDASACFIDCDSMVVRGRQALASVETADWNMPPEFAERPLTRAADAYKLGLVVLRLFARSHDARDPAAHLRYVPVELRDLLYRALSRDAVNRPPPGEWRRALGTVSSSDGLSNLPVPSRPPRIARQTSTSRELTVPSPPRQRRSVRSPSPPRPRLGPRRPIPHGGLVSAVTALWAIALIVVGVMLLSRIG